MEGGDGTLGEDVVFGLYDYAYHGRDLLVYSVEWPSECGGSERMQYILAPLTNDEHCPVATALIKATGKWTSDLHKEVYVFDRGDWEKSSLLWKSIQAASWNDVILDPAMKDPIIQDVHSFFDSRNMHAEYGVAWKRGIIFHGHPGCGKTITIKALMKSLQERDVASLYVKSFKAKQGSQYSIREIFEAARTMAPCLLIFEDLDSLVEDKVRSYSLNEVDGLEKNDGILMIGSTNHLERLDPGISKRPSRFDRKYYYRLPGEKERALYCEYWREKLKGKMGFDEGICGVVAKLTEGFSFAYLQELFVQSLLSMVGGRVEGEDEDGIEGNGVDEAETEEFKEDAGERTKRTRPEVNIPEHLQNDPLMRILHKQAKALWRDFDSLEEDLHHRPKIAGGGENYDSDGD